MFLRQCEERNDEAIQSVRHEALDCIASLAMTKPEFEGEKHADDR